MASLRKYFLRDIHLKELFKGSSIAFIFKIFSVLLTYVFFYFFAKYYGASGLGIFNTCFTVLILSTVVAKLGLDTALVKYIAEFVAKKEQFKIKNLYLVSLFMILLSGLLISILIYVFSKQLSLLFFNNLLNQNLFKLIGFSVIPFSIFQLNSEYFRGLKKITAYSSLQNGTIYFILLVLIIIISKYYNQVDFIISSLFFTLLFLMLISTIYILTYPEKINQEIKSETQGKYRIIKKKLLSVSIPMLFSNSLFLIMNWTDTLMLSAFRGEEAVGIYNVALKIASLNTIALIAINSIASPKFSEIYTSEGNRRFKRIVQQTTLLNWLVSIPVFILILMFPENALNIFGKEFIIGKNALIILSIGQMISALSGSTMIILNMTGREKVGRNIILVAVIINVLLNYILIPIFGIMGAAVATMTSTVFWNIASLIFIYKSFGFLTFPVIRKKNENNS